MALAICAALLQVFTGCAARQNAAIEDRNGEAWNERLIPLSPLVRTRVSRDVRWPNRLVARLSPEFDLVLIQNASEWAEPRSLEWCVVAGASPPARITPACTPTG